MKAKGTERGFALISFEDYYGVECSLQKSSLADIDAIWFGCNNANPRQLIHGSGWVEIDMPDEYIANTRMHLAQDQVKELLPHLIKFAKTGEI